MPIKVTIEIEERRVETLHIARISHNTSRHPDAVNRYSVVSTQHVHRDDPLLNIQYRDKTPHPDTWGSGVTFEHTYSDGVEVCVAKALDAYKQQQNSITKGYKVP